MSLIAPLSLLLGLLAAPIVLLYILRLRRRDVLISSTMLWTLLLRDKEANAPWQRLRRHLLMLIQLTILALLVFALARPYLPVPAVTTGNVVVLLDGSASMLADEGEKDRLTIAVQEVDRLIDDLSNDSLMTLILVGNSPRVLASGSPDRSALREALAQAEAAPVDADWPAAVALAAGVVQGYQDGRIVLVSDGGLPQDLPPLPAEVIYQPVGVAEENLAISALSTRDGPGGPQLFASITNHGRVPQQALLELSLDGELFDARRVEVPVGGHTNLTWKIPEGATVVSAALLENAQDYLGLDDKAWAVHESGARKRVLLLTEGNRFLETVLSVLPGLDTFKFDPEREPTENSLDEFDLVVMDSVPIPEDLPATEMLIINPQGTTTDGVGQRMPQISIGGVFTNTDIVRLEDDPLQRFVDWSAVNVRVATEVEAPWASPLVVAEGGPLLMAGEWDGHRTVILTFALQDSDLPLQIAFPIVMANIMNWLDLGASVMTTTDYAPGEPVRIGAGSGADTILIRDPGGAMWSYRVDGTTVLFPETDQLGLYEVLAHSEDGNRLMGRFTVNLMSIEESRIAPAETVQIGSRSSGTSSESNVGQRELWPWFAALALIVLMLEWWVYHRGAHFPNREDWYALTRRQDR
jgi:hypothetical protein